MASWNQNPVWTLIDLINNGKQIEPGDGFLASDMVKIVENLQYLYNNNIINLENGTGTGSLKQKSYSEDGKNPIATGIGSVAFGGLRFDYDPEKHSGDKTNTAAGGQSFVTGCGNYTAGDWSFVTGKDNTVYSNRAFVSGGANVSQATDSGGHLLEEKTNVGRFNAIFGNNNTFKSSDTSKESNLIAGGSNTVDTERSVVVGYNNNVAGHYDAIFGFRNVVNADYSLTGGQGHLVNGSYHLVAGSNNEVSGQYNIASGQDNNNAGWNSAVIGRELIVGKDHTAQTVLGQYNDNKPDTVLEIGWGDVNNRKNIFEVYKDGVVKTEKGTLSTEEYAKKYTDNAAEYAKKYTDNAVAAIKRKLNIGTTNTDSEAVDSLTVGMDSKNKGAQSAAIGYDAYVGYDSKGKPLPFRPTGAIALGWSRANADYSLSAGYDTEVNHNWSVALNNKTNTGASAQTVVGSFNVGKNNTAFEVGNGVPGLRSNAFEVLQDGRAKVQSAPVDDDDVVRKADLANVGGGKLYKHFITIKFSGTTKIGYAYLTLVDNYDKSYDINKLNTNYFNNGTVYLICRITGNNGDGVGNITYYNDGFAYVAGIFASGSGGSTSVLTGISEAPLFISSVSDTYTEI